MAEPLKNMFNARFFKALSTALQTVYSSFDERAFLSQIYDTQWERRELKERMRHITTCLHNALPGNYRDALAILRQAALIMGDFNFETMIFPDFVEVYGLDDWEASLTALEQFTQQSSAEYAVRPFIQRDQQQMMKHMLDWTAHESHHVRRLASEGCRPRLPWATALPALKADPSPIFPILERLKLDESEYVRRSVANNLNDITKDHPQEVIDVLRLWQGCGTPDMQKLTSHALRMLVKQGNPAALALLGYQNGAQARVNDLLVKPPIVSMGEDMTVTFSINSLAEQSQPLLIDYVIYHMRANGQQTPKVFKLTKVTLAAHETRHFSKKHSFRAITTRKYYPGDHAVEIQINGVSAGRKGFQISRDSS